MSFLDLPQELLALIAEKLGPHELRTAADYLLICKDWYRAALPVFLSNLNLSNVYLSYEDLRRLPHELAPFSDLLRAQTKRLSIRLIGHPSKKRAITPFLADGTQEEDEEENDNQQPDLEGEEGDIRELNQGAGEENESYWMLSGPMKICSQPRVRYVWDRDMDERLLPWMKTLNHEDLPRLSNVLSSMKNLRELSFTASSEYDASLGPRWDYLLNSTMHTFISRWPESLASLTLDTCGSKTSPANGDGPHLCALLAGRLDNLRDVRLRMRCICPAIFPKSGTSPFEDSRLQKMVIKLSLPFLPEAESETHDGRKEFDADLCAYELLPTARRLRECKETPTYDPMVRAASQFAFPRRKLKMLRVSYRQPSYSGTNLVVADCVNRRHLIEPGEYFTYEDDGVEWDGWEEYDKPLRSSDINRFVFDHIFTA